MEQEIQKLKQVIQELEKDNFLNNDSDVLNKLDEIICICQKIKGNTKKQVEVDTKRIKCTKINSITFLYKPLHVRNYFDGDYIVKFADERSKDLKEAKALEAHNEFWMQHKTLKGNIFGSVPLELLKEESIKELLSLGWLEAEVDILDLKKCSDDLKEIIKFCEDTFNYYILINEELTNTHLILHYKI